ncbi:ABC transporter permease [Halanaerobacter jeridensis]|uniref:Osmoprotectant transport system permease protein n=1 Tax=Halanaerobacter jeridensis TaxID=706427 RepID=A0A938XT94_9FIRM|nr:ABC transporter permease [Halanaerobacter jeridensis]MBM7557414.1 osmoprotectant transport system permease protein [Halanaerobacter jeridensis]
MIEFLINNWHQALVLAGEHLFIVLVATSLAAAIGIPLGILISTKEDWAPVVINVANIIMTIPSIALFGIMLPLLSIFNAGLGTVPVVIALILYSQLPIIRNTYTAIQNIDPAVVDSAKGIGLSTWRRLIEVELPLALPVIIAGLRIAIVMNIGIVTIAVYVGAGGLGKFIQRGIDQVYEEQIMAGALLVALLAIVVEALLYGVEYLVTPAGLKEGQQHD